MEDRFPGIKREQGSDDDDNEEGRPSRGRADFVRRGIPSDALFRRMFENSRGDSIEEDDDEEDEDDTTVGEKKRPASRRFRRSFGKLFRRRIVDGPQLLPEGNPSDTEANPAHPPAENVVPTHNFGDWLRRMSNGLDEETSEPGDEVSTDESEHNLGRPRISVAELLTRISSEVDESAPDMGDVTIGSEQQMPLDDVHEQIGLPAEAPAETVDVIDAENPQDVEYGQIGQTESIHQILQRQSGAEAGVDHNQPSGVESIPGNTTIVNETYNTINGWGPALVVDQLSRRRDRKIKRHDKQQDRRINEVEKSQVEQSKESVNDLQYLKNKVDKLQQTVVNPAPAEVVSIDKSVVPERLASPIELPEKFTPQMAKAEVKIAQEQREVPNKVDRITTAEVIQKTVEKAAEEAVPIESLYERRHEIKGNDDFAASAEAAIKTDTNYGVEPQAHDDSREIAARLIEQDNRRVTTNNSDLYGQAAKGGALLAVLIIVAFLVIYMLSR